MDGRCFSGAKGFGAAFFVSSALLLGAVSCARKPDAPPPAAPPEVVVLTLQPRAVPVIKEWVGTLDGSVNTAIRARVSGYLQHTRYKEGSAVKAGDLLFEIDPRPFVAALSKAEADKAQTDATLKKTQLDVDRYASLIKTNAISRETYDNAVQANLAAQAQVAAAVAAVEQARLNLEFTKITSPIDGIAGGANAFLGDLVGSATILTTVSTVDPIRVNMGLSEADYMQLTGERGTGRGRKPGDRASAQLVLVDGSLHPEPGVLAFIDRQVDPTTGTFRVAIDFPNPGDRLRPGQFGRLRAEVERLEDALVVPQRAVMELQGRHTVAVVGPDNKASIRPVKPGPRVGQEWVILEGLSPGERVVIDGVQKARDGAVVRSTEPAPPAAKP
jgi:RND family efflux transporter MFP subunit